MNLSDFDSKKSKEQLTILHKNILRIASVLRKKERFFDMISLFEVCCKELPNPEPEIDGAIRDLYRMKFIIEGKQLFKEEILTNEKRKKILDYILKYPGAHHREIRSALELGDYMAYRHLALLEKFGFLRKKSYQNKLVYFPTDFDEDEELEILVLRNEITRKIYDSLKEHEELRLSEFSDILQVPYTTIQSHLSHLVENGLVQKIKKDQISYYIIPATKPEVTTEEEVVEVKREYDYVGGSIRFKVAVRNLTKMAIHNIAVSLNPSEQFISDVPLQNIANLPHSTTRGLDFTLSPLTCGQSKVFGSVSFEDAFGKVHSIPIRPKELSIKCPLVQPLTATQVEVNEWIKNLRRGTGQIGYENISDADAFRIGLEQVCALDLNEIKVSTEEMWGLYSGQVKVTGKNMVVKVSIIKPNILLDVWAEDLQQTTGFIAYIKNLINIALASQYKMFRKTEDISQKIIDLMTTSTAFDEIFMLCQNLGEVSEINTRLNKAYDLLKTSFSDADFLQSINDTCTYFMMNYQPSSRIEEQLAFELRFKLINWLRKVQELIQYHIKTYETSFDDLSIISGDFSAGLNMIKEIIVDHEKSYGMGILSYLMILDKTSGITLFEKDLANLGINPDLIGGFLHALQSFGHEISASEGSMKTLTYDKYQFQIETGKFVRAALIIRCIPNSFIISRLQQFVKQFEQNFETDITHFTGNMDVFRPAGALFVAIFR
ncbi:MAG TPA: helix-turn-helix domain-containing protein [Candidatus Deferrimicrobium sp.]|nr:helix-turn-helix domain-containing protein [Candidatus Deferrimicrobium sp.]